MPARSAGILLYRRARGAVQVLLVHPGGPFWRNKDGGAWSIPKGEYGPGEAAEAAARREFAEELGHPVVGALTPLGAVRQGAGKEVEGFAVEGDFDVERLASNVFEIEWPPRSGRRQSFPEVDRAQWFAVAEARAKINAGQLPLLDRLEALLAQ